MIGVFSSWSILLFFGLDHDLISYPSEISVQAQQIIRYTISVSTFIWLLLMFFYVYRVNYESEQTLSEKNRELEKEIARRSMAEEIQQHYNMQLKLKNKELEQFAYVASHDLQEPLRTMSSYVELLEKQYGHSFDSTAETYVNFVLTASLRMKRLIKDLLDYSRIGKNREAAQTDLNLLVKEVLEDIAEAVTVNKAVIHFANLPTASVFASDLKLLFQNLLLNAIKFQQPGQEPVIVIQATDENTYWKFKVVDNGIGIEEKFHEKIFAIFQRLHVRAEFEGNGIGLAHCQKIVELHGGNIWVESSINNGSTFYFTIPKRIL